MESQSLWETSVTCWDEPFYGLTIKGGGSQRILLPSLLISLTVAQHFPIRCALSIRPDPFQVQPRSDVLGLVLGNQALSLARPTLKSHLADARGPLANALSTKQMLVGAPWRCLRAPSN